MTRPKNQICIRPQCPNAVAQRRLCLKHYRWYLEGRANAGIPAYVTADIVRVRCEQLRDAGLPDKQIARLAGVTALTVKNIIDGKYSTVRIDTHRQLMAVKVPTHSNARHVVTHGIRIDSTGTLRRLRALIALGYTQRYLAGRMNMLEANFSVVILGVKPKVEAGTARAAEALYEELSGTPPTRPSKRSLARAKKLGWLPPLRWDDDKIDDPKARPARQKPNVTFDRAQETADRRARVQHLTRCGWSAPRIAAHLGITERTVQRDRADQEQIRSAS